MAYTTIGKIHSVIVKDFITYNYVEMFPGTNLNVLIGPNGSGKSTLVAAIVIGMGGSCRTLSRGKVLMDYIKNGKTEASVSIELYKDEEENVMHFRRSFNKDGKEEFLIDKKRVTQKVYMEHVRNFNIQIDNLCQFLPQDRVQDFAKMNPQEIFANTLSSVCGANVQRQYEELRAIESSSETFNANMTKWKTELKEAESVNDELKVRIDNMAERTLLEQKLQIAKVKKIQVHLDTIQAKKQNCELDCEKAKQCLQQHQESLAPIEAECQEYTRQVEIIEGAVTSCMDEETKLHKTFLTLKHDADDFDDKIRMSKVSVQNAKKHKESQESEIIQAANLLSAHLQDLQTFAKEQPALEAKKAALQQSLSDKQYNYDELEKERMRLKELRDEDRIQINTVKRKISELKEVEKRHLAAMETRFPDMYKATMWLRDNRDMFRGQVYDPIVIELKLKDARDGKYLESLIPIRDLTAIVCEDTEDMKEVVKKLTMEMHLMVNVLQCKAASQLKYSSNISIDSLRRYGFSKYILDMVAGPLPILNYLCEIYKIHNIPVGTQEVDIDTVISSGIVSFFFTPNHRYSITKSKYSTASTTTCIEIQGKRMLSVLVKPEEILNQQKELCYVQDKCDAKSNEISECERKLTWNDARTKDDKIELKDIERKIQQNAGLGRQVEMQRRKLEELKNTVIDVETEENECKKIVIESAQELVKVVKKMINLTETYEKKRIELLYHREYLKKYHTANANLQAQISTARMSVENAKRLVGQLQKVVEMWDKKVRDYEARIKKLIVDVFHTEQFAYTQRPEFQELPDTEEEIEEQINILQAQVDCMEGHNDKVKEEYENRVIKIEELQELIASHKGQRHNLNEKLNVLHDKWYPEMGNIITKINEKFSTFMASMGYAGEVSLTYNGKFEYSSYGIAIKVLYRKNETLRQLNSHLQSGGERTVAIATYTMALQQLSHVPFRCVDEINQGMDPKNERKVFEMLVDETSKPGMSQYFFVTPKLLPNLKTTDNIMFHCVFNGPDIDSPGVFTCRDTDVKPNL